MKNLFRTKPIDHIAGRGLKPVLGATDLVLMGIGAIIGAGVFVLTGIGAADHAGPALVLSFMIAGTACAFAALSYAELATTIGGCGSAYGYGYAALGEIVGWLIGWILLLEYGMAVSTVAVGWSGYVNNALLAVGHGLPEQYLKPFTEQGGLLNLPATLIILLLTGLLASGAYVSAKFNAAMVAVKLAALFLFIAIALFHVDPANWSPFIPERLVDAEGHAKYGMLGVVEGAAVIFFAYIGFDAVSTAAEETKNPQRNVPIGIIGSLVVCTLLYIVVSLLLTGVVPYTELGVASPVADALLRIGQQWGSAAVAAGAIAGLTTVMLVMFFGLTRVLLAMCRDGLLPRQFAVLGEHSKSPVRIILVSGVLLATAAGLLPIESLAKLVNMGTLAAFTVVCLGVIWLRKHRPELPRPFKTPLSPLFPTLGALSCVYLMLNLPLTTWIAFATWSLIGLVVYAAYSYRHSHLTDAAASAG